jgi:hypothetical protein
MLRCAHLQIVVNNNETRMAAFEIPAKNRKSRENNKPEQARPKKINHLAEASGFIPPAEVAGIRTGPATGNRGPHAAITTASER